MREMKDSGIEWIGNIPIQWSTLPIRFLLSEHISGSWGNDEQHNDNDRICVRIADFDYSKIQFKENIDYTIRNYSTYEIYYKTLQIGDLLIEKSGGGEKTPVGRTVVYRLPYNALFANFMDCIRLKPEYNVEYIKYAFWALYNNGITNLYYNQTTGIQNLNMTKYFREVKLTIPSIEEQVIVLFPPSSHSMHVTTMLSFSSYLHSHFLQTIFFLLSLFLHVIFLFSFYSFIMVNYVKNILNMIKLI